MKNTIYGMATLLAVNLALLPTVSGEVITLGNKLLQVKFNEAGLTQIRNKDAERTIDIAGDHCVLKVDDLVFDSRAMSAKPKKDGQSVTYGYRSGPFGLKVVYELRPGWRFLSKQIFEHVETEFTGKVK